MVGVHRWTGQYKLNSTGTPQSNTTRPTNGLNHTKVGVHRWTLLNKNKLNNRLRNIHSFQTIRVYVSAKLVDFYKTQFTPVPQTGGTVIPKPPNYFQKSREFSAFLLKKALSKR